MRGEPNAPSHHLLRRRAERKLRERNEREQSLASAWVWKIARRDVRRRANGRRLTIRRWTLERYRFRMPLNPDDPGLASWLAYTRGLAPKPPAPSATVISKCLVTQTERATMLAILEASTPRTPELAQALGISRRAAWRRLARLARKGWVEPHLTTYPQTFQPVVYWPLSARGRAAAAGAGLDA